MKDPINNTQENICLTPWHHLNIALGNALSHPSVLLLEFRRCPTLKLWPSYDYIIPTSLQHSFFGYNTMANVGDNLKYMQEKRSFHAIHTTKIHVIKDELLREIDLEEHTIVHLNYMHFIGLLPGRFPPFCFGLLSLESLSYCWASVLITNSSISSTSRFSLIVWLYTFQHLDIGESNKKTKLFF